MPSATKSRRVAQLPLFQPPVTAPRWESFPQEVRRQTLGLLVRWLRAHTVGGAPVEREVRDE
jgi:hypothetical protein